LFLTLRHGDALHQEVGQYFQHGQIEGTQRLYLVLGRRLCVELQQDLARAIGGRGSGMREEVAMGGPFTMEWALRVQSRGPKKERQQKCA